MIAAIHQPQYIPWLGYFDKIAKSDVFILLDNVQFKKNDWQNRNRIKTSHGWQWLSVPVHNNFRQMISEVKIYNQDIWNKVHLKAIQYNYSKTPYYAEYINFFESVYSRRWENLVDLNIFIIENIVKFLNIKTSIVKASDFPTIGKSTERLVELCQMVEADTYLSGVDGKKYMELELFKENNVDVLFQDYKHPVYNQINYAKNNQEFISNLSIIDLLFNYGFKSLEILDINSIVQPQEVAKI